MSPAGREKLRIANTGKRHSAETRAKTVGERNTNWKGDDASRGAIHQVLNRQYPKSGRCEACGKEAPTDYAYKHHPKRHTRTRDDYMELCKSCHKIYDDANGSGGGKGRPRGFVLSPEQYAHLCFLEDGEPRSLGVQPSRPLIKRKLVLLVKRVPKVGASTYQITEAGHKMLAAYRALSTAGSAGEEAT